MWKNEDKPGIFSWSVYKILAISLRNL